MDTSIACHPKSYQISSPRQCQYYHLPNVSTDLFDMPNMWHVVLTSRCQSWGEDHSFLEREHHRKQQKQTRYGVHILCKYKQRRLCVTPAPQYTRKNPYIYIYIYRERERETWHISFGEMVLVGDQMRICTVIKGFMTTRLEIIKDSHKTNIITRYPIPIDAMWGITNFLLNSVLIIMVSNHSVRKALCSLLLSQWHLIFCGF